MNHMTTDKKSSSAKSIAKGEHGTIASYIIGFILSLIFTIIPYYLVVNKVLTGTALLLAILTIAVWQMIIQLVFFLHLGRGPKPFYNVVFFFATAGTIVVVIAASLFIMDNLYRTMSPQELVLKQSQGENIAQIGGKETGACNELRKSHVVTISDGVATPNSIQTDRCDTLSFVNQDGVTYEISFSTYSDDVSYGGMDKVVIGSGKSETITLNESGDFTFSDRSAGLRGSFFVVP